MVRTRVGYAGGTVKNPTYHSIGDHSEAIQIVYDPEVISYEQLLDIFWSSHNPGRRSWSRQYASLILYHSEAQRKLAEETRARKAAEIGGKVYTTIAPAAVFYPAEDYHQKYRLQHERDLMAEFRAIYPDYDDLVGSTAVARVNGYLGGYGTCERLQEELDDLGLSVAGRETLTAYVCGAAQGP